MKYIFFILILLATFLSVNAVELPESLTDMAEEYAGDIRIWGVNDDDFEDDNENEFFVLKFSSFVDYSKSIPFEPLIRVTVQLTDRKTKTVVFSQIKAAAPKVSARNAQYYSGHRCECLIPYGTMKRPKLSACAVEIGFKQDGYFVPVYAEYDKADSAEEIMHGEGNEVSLIWRKPKVQWN